MRGTALAPALPAAIALALVLVSGCRGPVTTGSGALRVVATTTQIADFARNVGGERITLTRLLPPNADPHEFEPTPRDVGAVAGAALVLQNGIGLDDWLDGVIANAGGGARRVRVSDGVRLLTEPGEPLGNPHIWLDPRNAAVMVGNVERAFAAADPAGGAVYRANADRYRAELRALDRELAARIATVPAADRAIATDHDAFGYFADRYGIRVVGAVIASASTAAEPSPKEVTALVGVIRRSGARAVFGEAGADPRLERAVAAEAGVRLGRPLYEDSLAPDGEPAGTYLGMMRANMDAVVAGIRP